MQYGPNSEQVEAYLEQVAHLGAHDWASLALVLNDPTGPSEAAGKAIEMARSRAKRHGLLSDVDAAARAAHEVLDTTLEASTGLREVVAHRLEYVGPDDLTLTAAPRGAGVAALRWAATSGATLLVLRPLLDKGEFLKAWPMRSIDPQSLPDHVYAQPFDAIGL